MPLDSARHQGPRPTTSSQPAARRHRTLFLSDMHLGTHGCKAPALLDFLRRNEADTTYLVGDVFDNWRPLGAHWTVAQEQVVKLLLDRARAGQRMVYLPGNHDDFFGRYLGRYFDDLEIVPECWHETASGERLLVTHGDACDLFAHRLPVLAKAGAWTEAVFRWLDTAVQTGCRSFGLPEWTFIDRGVAVVNNALRSRDQFEVRLSDLARSRGADGIVCGHFHKPALHRDHGVLYANCGDWIEHCSALAERADGTLFLLQTDSDTRPAPSSAVLTQERELEAEVA